MSHFLDLPEAKAEYLRSATLPYNLTDQSVLDALNRVYDVLFTINSALVERGYSRLEEVLLGNSFAGILSELIVKSLAISSDMLVTNEQIGGFPDLLPTDQQETAILKSEEGIEVKASKQSSGWQGHNAESGWYMICRYVIDVDTMPVERRKPTEIVEVMIAKLDEEDWSFSGRRAGSRRTPTASIRATGTYKLRSNAVYVHPDYYIEPRKPRGRT